MLLLWRDANDVTASPADAFGFGLRLRGATERALQRRRDAHQRVVAPGKMRGAWRQSARELYLGP